MKKEKRLNQVTKMVQASLSNLFQNQSELSGRVAKLIIEVVSITFVDSI